MSQIEKVRILVLEEFREEGSVGSLGALAAKLGSRRDLVFGAMRDLVDCGQVAKSGTYHSPCYRLVSEGT